MSDETRTVQMYVVNPGATEKDGEFSFEMQSRINAGRTVKFALVPSDAELLHRKLGEYLKAQQK